MFERRRVGQLGVFVQQPGQNRLIEAAPVDADAYRLVIAAGKFDHLSKLRIALRAAPDIAGIDAVFTQCLGTGGVFFEQLVAVEVEVTDDRHMAAFGVQLLTDSRDSLGRGLVIDRDANQFRAGAGEFVNLLDRAGDVRRVGVGHGLDDNRGAAADLNVSDFDSYGVFASDHG